MLVLRPVHIDQIHASTCRVKILDTVASELSGEINFKVAHIMVLPLSPVEYPRTSWSPPCVPEHLSIPSANQR